MTVHFLFLESVNIQTVDTLKRIARIPEVDHNKVRLVVVKCPTGPGSGKKKAHIVYHSCITLLGSNVGYKMIDRKKLSGCIVSSIFNTIECAGR